METTLQYVRTVLNSKFSKVKEMMRHIIRIGTGKWFKNVDSYIKELNTSWEEIESMTKGEIKKMIRDYDNACWKENMDNKDTLKLYREGKNKIGYDFCYRNNVNSMYLARARMNSLRLEEAIGRSNEKHNRNCKLCNREMEDMTHFLIKCPKLEDKRDYSLIDKKIEDPEKRLVELLFKLNKHQETGHIIRTLWNERLKILKSIEDKVKKQPGKAQNKVGAKKKVPKRRNRGYNQYRIYPCRT